MEALGATLTEIRQGLAQSQVAQANTAQILTNLVNQQGQQAQLVAEAAAQGEAAEGGAGGPRAQVVVVPRGQPRAEVRLRNFSGGTPDEYRRWEDHVGRCLQANDWQFPRAAHAILSAFQDKAADMARTLEGAGYANWEALKTDLRRIFMSPSYRNTARAQFENRIQQDGEDLATYHGLLLSLRNSAYEAPDRNEGRLIERFIAGIKDSKLHENLHFLVAAGNGPVTYEGALEIALRVKSEWEIIELENRRKKYGGKLDYRKSAMTTPQPMELGAVMNKYCSFHKVNSHNTNECKAKQKAGGKVSNQFKNKGGFNKNKSQQADKGKRTPGPNDKCGKCKGYGHWRRHCPSANSGQTGKGKKFQKSTVNTVTQSDSAESTDEEPTEQLNESENEVWGSED